jgi:TRAP-type C4-dicarboxylate transport system substrate-binding protein
VKRRWKNARCGTPSPPPEKLKAAGVEFITVDKKPFYDATASVREKYGAQYADLMKRIDAVQ